MHLSESRVLLTGASGGLGTAVARQLVTAGARVLLVGRSLPALSALADELSAIRSDCVLGVVAADVTSDSGREDIRLAAVTSDINVLINNAGVSAFGTFEDLSADILNAAVQTNLLAPMLLTARLLPQLMRQQQAVIVNVGSTLGSVGVPGFAVYGSTKSGLRSFSEALRRELVDSPVRVQYFAPRAISTSFNDSKAVAFNNATGSSVDLPDAVGKAMVNMIESKKAEKFLGAFEHLAARLNGLFPRLIDGSFTKHREALARVATSRIAGE